LLKEENDMCPTDIQLYFCLQEAEKSLVAAGGKKKRKKS